MDFTAILQAAGTQGIWALLFVALFIWTMNENKKEKDRILNTLDKYATCFEGLKADVADIKSDVEELKTNK